MGQDGHMQRVTSLGRRQLVQELERRELRRVDVATAIGVTAAIVTLWCTGLRRPNRENAAALEDYLGIPSRAWVTNVEVDEEAAA